jgi:hypothetical protein
MVERGRYKHMLYMILIAERGGFEPPFRIIGKRFSRPPLSTTQPSLYDVFSEIYPKAKSE